MEWSRINGFIMKNRTTIIVLAGILALIASAFSVDRKVVERPPVQKVQDTINPLLIPIDSIESYGGLRFKPYKKSVHASYYADKFNGRRTASGKKFNNNKYYAAHRKLPFGTKLRVTNEQNGACVIVEVADRGPFTKGREIDLSKRAFRDIAHNTKTGGLNVTIEVVH